MRPSRQQMFMEIAQVVAKRSTCFRLNVGAVVVVNDRIVSIGYNGAPAGEPHCSGNSCPGVVPGNCPTIHAEVNALRHLPDALKNHDIAKDIYITHMPCFDCANRMLEFGVKRAFYETPYRYVQAVDLLLSFSVEVYQITPAGYVVKYPNREVVTL